MIAEHEYESEVSVVIVVERIEKRAREDVVEPTRQFGAGVRSDGRRLSHQHFCVRVIGIEVPGLIFIVTDEHDIVVVVVVVGGMN